MMMPNDSSPDAPSQPDGVGLTVVYKVSEKLLGLT